MKVTRALGSVTKDRDNGMDVVFDIGKKEAERVKFTCILAAALGGYVIFSIVSVGDEEVSLMCFFM